MNSVFDTATCHDGQLTHSEAIRSVKALTVWSHLAFMARDLGVCSWVYFKKENWAGEHSSDRIRCQALLWHVYFTCRHPITVEKFEICNTLTTLLISRQINDTASIKYLMQIDMHNNNDLNSSIQVQEKERSVTVQDSQWVLTPSVSSCKTGKSEAMKDRANWWHSSLWWWSTAGYVCCGCTQDDRETRVTRQSGL